MKFFEMKYKRVFRYLLLLHEWIYLITNQKLFKEQDKIIFQRYFVLIERCKDKNVKSCEDLCREFNVNKKTYLMEGEKEALLTFMDNAGEIMEQMHMKNFFKKNKLKKWSLKSMKSYSKKHSVLSKKLWGDPFIKKLNQKYFAVKLNPGEKKVIKRKFHKYEVEIETLDDELDSKVIYKIANEPVDFSNFIILFEEHRGINFYENKGNNYWNNSVNDVLAMVNNQKHSGIDNISEMIEKQVIKVITPIQVDSITAFVNDFRLDFNPFEPIKQDPKEELSFLRKILNKLFSLILK